ncbi:MAG: rod shape-determining protein MreC [Candidatus Delongbacteria bacterium]|nr:rod shape-determining protein MreC [Candidatus Delongbacteria bacterium]
MTPVLKEWIYLISAVAVSVFFIAFNDSSFNDTLSKAGLDAYSLLNYDYFSFREKHALENELKELKTELALLEHERNSYISAIEENKRLKEILSIELPDSVHFIYAKRIGKSAGSYTHTILISSGTEYGAENGDAVVTKYGVAGYIIEAGEKVSKVRLVSDPSNKIAVRTENSRAHGILIPSDQKNANIEEITKTAQVEEGENIYTADFSEIFPAGLLLAKTVFVSDSSATINKIIHVEFTQDPDLIEDVLILKISGKNAEE